MDGREFSRVVFMPRKALSGFGVEIEVSKQLVVSPEKVVITLRVFNGTRQPVTLKFQEQPPQDLVVKNREGKEVWNWSHGKVFPQVIPPSVTVTNKKPLVFEQAWDLKGNDGNTVEMGMYSVKGVVNCKPLRLKAATILDVGLKIMK